MPSLLLHLPQERLCQCMTQPVDTHETVTSQHNDLPLFQGTSVTPSGLFPSVRNSPIGSLVRGTHAEAKLRATKSLRAWCLADLPGALLQTKLWSPPALTAEPQWQWCEMQRSNPNRKPTSILTASSSNLSPHEAIGSAKSQSPLRCEEATRHAIVWTMACLVAIVEAIWYVKPCVACVKLEHVFNSRVALRALRKILRKTLALRMLRS